MTKYFAVLLSLLLISCGQAAGPRQVLPPIVNTDDPVQCQAQGGELRQVCLSRTTLCIVRARDAGQRCSDGSECQSGQCHYSGSNPPRDRAVTGRCAADNNPCGCHARIRNGRTEGQLCID